MDYPVLWRQKFSSGANVISLILVKTRLSHVCVLFTDWPPGLGSTTAWIIPPPMTPFTNTVRCRYNADNILNKANLRDLIAATGLVILLKFDPNHRFLSLVTLKFDGWPWKTIGHLFYTHQALSIISNPLVNWNWSYSPETLNSGQNRRFFVLCDLEIGWMTLENNRAPLLYYIKLCASFQIHRWIQIGVTVRKRSIWVNIGNFCVPCDLVIWRMTSKNNRAPLKCCFKLCA